MALSKDLSDTLNENVLYKKEPVIDNSYHIGNIPGTYWCKNWTFRVHKLDGGNVYMYDTYWDDFNHSIEITDENFNEFIPLFDFRNVTRIPESIADEYYPKDVFCVAVDSGGINNAKYYVKDGAKKNREAQIKKKLKEIEDLKSSLKAAELSLKLLQDGL